MDYDKTQMPASYDAGRSYPPPVLALWLDVVARHAAGIAVRDVLDLGCGTGRFSEGLARRFHANVIAVDPSEKMLAIARSKSANRVRYERAGAESLPLPADSVDIVFMSMVLHHFNDPLKALSECRRVLRPGGVVCLRAGTREQSAGVRYLEFFPSTWKILERTFQSRKEIENCFRQAGFVLARHESVLSEIAANWSEYAHKVSQRADSILIQLSDEEFENGMTRLRAHVPENSGSAVAEPVDFFVFR